MENDKSDKLTTKDRKAIDDIISEASMSDEDRCYVLRLYVTGQTPNSKRAIENLRAILEEHLKGRYQLEVVDLYQQPTLAEGEQILAAPTLIKKLPLPIRHIIGDMSNKERVLVGLDMRPKDNEH